MRESWDRDRLLMEVPHFSFSRRGEAEGEVARYLDFYHIHFSQEMTGVKQSMGWFDTLDFRVMMHYFRPAKPIGTVFVLHGYFDHVGLYGHLIRFLLQHNYAVVMYDMPGHGLSSGKPAAIANFEQYQTVLNSCLNLCEGKVPKPYHAVGQSTGGAVLIDRMMYLEATSPLPKFDKIVLLAPLVRPKAWRAASILHSLINPFSDIWYRTFSVNSDDQAFISFIKEHDPLQSRLLSLEWLGALKKWVPRIEKGRKTRRRVQVIQGTDDMTVEWKHNIEVIRSKFTDVAVSFIQNGRHHLVNESFLKRQQVFEIILQALQSKDQA